MTNKKDKAYLEKFKSLTGIDYKDALAIASSFAVEGINVCPEDLLRKEELERKYPIVKDSD